MQKSSKSKARVPSSKGKEEKKRPVAQKEMKKVSEAKPQPAPKPQKEVKKAAEEEKKKPKIPEDEEEEQEEKTKPAVPKADSPGLEEGPDMDQMMADIMGGFSSLSKPGGSKKPEKQKLPFVSSLEVKTTKEIIKEYNKAIASKDSRLVLSLLKGLHDHTDLPKEEKLHYLEEEGKYAIELGHIETALSAGEAMISLDPYNANANFVLLNALLMEESDKTSTIAGRVFQRAIAVADNPDLFEKERMNPKLREELQQTLYKIRIRLERIKRKDYLLAVTSSYINECLGANESVILSRLKKEKQDKNSLVVSIPEELSNHKILTASCGDFHTLVLTYGSLLANDKDKKNYANWTDVYGFGQNIHGQVTGLTGGKKMIVEPTVVPFFIGKQIKYIAAKGSRSLAISELGEIYEWGFPNALVSKIGFLENVVDAKIGLTFNLYLTKSEECYIQGRLTDSTGDTIVEYPKPTFVGMVWQIEDKKFIEIATGYNHAILLAKTGRVYVWGTGQFGQLGLSREIHLLVDPYPIDMMCDENEAIVHVYANAYHTFALSNLGVLYHWGLMKPSGIGKEGVADSDVIWSPTICRLDDSIRVIDVGGLQHEIIILDASGKIFSLSLSEMRKDFQEVTCPKFFSPEYQKIAGCGMGHQIYIKPFLVPERCSLALTTNVWTSGEEVTATLKLVSNFSTYQIFDVENINISLAFFSNAADPLANYDYGKYLTLITKHSRKPEEEEKTMLSEGRYLIQTVNKMKGMNEVQFDSQFRVSETRSNEVIIGFCPKDATGKFFLHILINETYIEGVPIEVEIKPNPALDTLITDDDVKRRQQMRKNAELARRKEAEEKEAALQLELKAKREREENEEKRRRATEERAAEKLKELQKKIKETEKKIAEDRKARLELITGGGFNLSKLPKKS